MKRFPVYLLTSIVLLISGAGHCAAAQDNEPLTLLYRSDWSKGIDPRLTIQAPPGAVTIVQNSAFDSAALRIIVHRMDNFKYVANGTPRAEVVFALFFRFVPGFLYEVRWTTMTPRDYTFDYAQPELFSQILQGPKGGSGSPPFSIRFVKARYQVEVRNAGDSPPQVFVFGNPSGDRGKVVSWTLRYAPDHNGSHAVTDLYMNGMRVVHCERCGNAYANDQDAYLKLGLYKWWWQSRPSDVQERMLYFGNVQVRRSGANGGNLGGPF